MTSLTAQLRALGLRPEQIERCTYKGKPLDEVDDYKPKLPPNSRDLGDAFAALWERFGPYRKHPLMREYRFHPTRRWRFDCAWPDQLVAVEMEGGVWTRGRHTRPVGYQKDIEKYNAAAIAGWRVLQFAANDMELSPVQTIEQVAALLEANQPT